METQRKLDEAQFFLFNLKEVHINPEFDYFLSAFLSSARSVLWIMRFEYGGVYGWEKWFVGLSASETEDFLLKTMTNLRNENLKVRPIRTNFAMEFSISPRFVDDERLSIMDTMAGKSGTLKFYQDIEDVPEEEIKQVLPAKLVSSGRSVVDFPEQPIIGLCEKYCSFLEKVVFECRATFGPKRSTKS